MLKRGLLIVFLFVIILFSLIPSVDALVGDCVDCTEGAGCEINSACSFNVSDCSGGTCDFTSVLINDTLSAGVAGAGVNDSANITFIVINDFNITADGVLNFSGKANTGGNGGKGGVVNISAYNFYSKGEVWAIGGEGNLVGYGGSFILNSSFIQINNSLYFYGGNGGYIKFYSHFGIINMT